MAKLTRGFAHKISAHHIIEQRVLKNLGLDVDKAPAIILSKGQHEYITGRLRDIFKHRTDFSKLSKAEIIAGYKEAYKSYPQAVKALDGL